MTDSKLTYAYNLDDQLLAVGGAVAYDYNDNGYREHRYAGANATEYVYTTAGQLLGVHRQVYVNDEWVADENAPQVTYQLDALGRRVVKRVGNDVVEKYLWAGHNMTLLAVYDAEDEVLARFEYGAGRMPVRMTQGEDTYYFAYDQVGSLRAVFDDACALVHEITYDSYGNIQYETTNSGLCVPFGFAGGLHDRDTGLVLFGFRDYDPETGTWLTPDPIGFAGGDVYLYGYCGGDPVNWVDVDGRSHLYLGTGKIPGHGYVVVDWHEDGKGMRYEYGPDRREGLVKNMIGMFTTQGTKGHIYLGSKSQGASLKFKIDIDTANQIDKYWKQLLNNTPRYSLFTYQCWNPVIKTIRIAYPNMQFIPPKPPQTVTTLDAVYRNGAFGLLQ